MALDVWIGEPTRLVGGPVVSFEPEAYYWFLYPLFEEFAQVRGRMIDLYDGAIFQPSELNPILELVDKAKELASAQSEDFRVHIGTKSGNSFDPRHKEIYEAVNRSAYLEFIEQLRAAALTAQGSGKPLVFVGD